MILLDGKVTSASAKIRIISEVKALLASGKRPPHLCAILVGNDGASETYVSSKARNCEEVGFKSTLLRYPDSVSEEILLDKIREINEDSEIDGLIVQLPLPPHIQVQKVTETISPRKDVDGFHPINIGRMVQNQPCYLPATPLGILLMLEHYGIETSGKKCVVIGRSNIVGLPMSILLTRNNNPGNCTVTICHSKTKNIEEITRTADILIAAIGKPRFVKASMVKDGAVVIDVGITRESSTLTKSGYKLAGDVDFEQVAAKAAYISPVPGGVGLMTIVGLLQNTLRAAKGEVAFWNGELIS
ncbi:MAG: bifunctional 5,10-methylene-tetrahydrofolate dehydrogenase/5,10-methylene-tetrahydrofolate cyclohydrolase [Bacteroidetes bacterium]|nr:bifunctional 5,10-methylene-tetrahydrofolate dehydrogenase/5,10-methylene-tetrahydrofolate cyclohydrolase [Bacteroidota bacterium]